MSTLSDNALQLLLHDDPGYVNQGIELVWAHEESFAPLMLSILLRQGYRAAAPALALCARDAAAAHPHALRLATAVIKEGMQTHGGLPDELRRDVLNTLSQPVGSLRAMILELVERRSGRGLAHSLRLLDKLRLADPEDYGVWSSLLSKALDTAAWDEFEATRGKTLRKIEASCIELLD